MKHFCRILLSALFFFTSFFSFASSHIPYDFSAGDFTFEFRGGDEVQVYSYTGNNTTVIIPETIIYESKEYKVTSIHNGFIYKKRHLIENVFIPNSVERIKNGTFSDCKNLTSVEISPGVTEIGSRTFQNCTSLTLLTIPHSVKIIEAGAFYDCPNLEIKIAPDNPYLYYDSGILYNKEQTVVLAALCNLEGEVHLLGSVLHISSHAFSSLGKIPTIVFPPDLKSIGNDAFWACRMDSIVFTGNKLDSIGEGSFKDCSRLESVSFPEGLKYIGKEAFTRCKQLHNITFPSSLGILGSGVFAETPWYENQLDGEVYISDVFYAYKNPPADLTSVTIREGIKSVAGSAFAGCSTLQTVTFPEGLKYIGERAFYWCENIETVNSTDGITYVGKSAFENCSKLKLIKLSDSLERIESKAFDGCINLELTKLPPELNYIGYSAFNGCNIAESIIIPDKVAYIGSGAFADCKKLQYFNIPESITAMGTNPFRNTKWYKKQKNGPVYIGKVFLDYKVRKNKKNAALSLKIEEGTEIIAEKSLESCRNFKKIEIPQSVTYIGYGNFRNGVKWEELTVHWENPSDVMLDDSFTFFQPQNCVLRVPKSTRHKYKSLNPWKYFYIVEAE